MRFCVLASGSKANCTFVEAGPVRLLIDCGLSAREVEKRLLQIGVAADSIQAVLVTHEHYDHVRGLEQFSRRFRVPVFANRPVKKLLRHPHGVEEFRTGEAFWLGAVQIAPVGISHDAEDPVAFVVQSAGFRFAQCTDLGQVTAEVRAALKGCHGMVLEFNHDVEMLWQCDYSWVLKNRIASSHGHLSNETAGALLADVIHSGLSHVVLGHISENSNSPEVALKVAARYVDPRMVKLCCANPYQRTDLFALDPEAANAPVAVG